MTEGVCKISASKELSVESVDGSVCPFSGGIKDIVTAGVSKSTFESNLSVGKSAAWRGEVRTNEREEIEKSLD